MDLSLAFCFTIAADALISRVIPGGRRLARVAFMLVFFAVQTVLIVALIGSPLHPAFRPQDLPHKFWLQVLTCLWWGPGCARTYRPTAMRGTAIENRLLSDIIAASIYVCSVLKRVSFAFSLVCRFFPRVTVNSQQIRDLRRYCDLLERRGF